MRVCRPLAGPSRVHVLVAAVVTAVLPGGTARADVADYLGKSIASVRLVIEERETTDPALLRFVDTRVGRPLSMADVRESVTHLFSLGRFEDVRADATLEPGGVALRYELSPIHPVTKIVFAGDLRAPGVDRGRLRRAVVDRFGASPPLGRAGEVGRVVAESLRERGYLHASVNPRAEIQHAPERARLVLTIEPGPRTRIGSVDIEGAPPALGTTLLSELRLSPGAPYERETIDARIERYVETQRKRGFYEAKVTPIVQLADGDRIANLTLAVARGPHVRVVFAGDPLPPNRRDELVPIEREGSVDEDLLEDSTHRIEEALRSEGYRDAAASYAREETDGELRITFTVKQGRLYRVDRLAISGNDSVPLSDVEPGLRLRSGQPFSDAGLEADRAFIEDLYRRRGFAGAKAQGTVTPRAGAGDSGREVAVGVAITVREGLRTLVGAVRIEGGGSVPEATLRAGLGLQPGQPYFEGQLAADRDAIVLTLADLGYQNASVEANPNFSADLTRADPLLVVREGPRIFVDHVLIVGNVHTSTQTIERELLVKPGHPLGLAAVNESQRRLASLGLFRRARITELGHGEETRRDVIVTVEEAPTTTVGYGAGGEMLLRVVRRAEDGGVAAQRVEFAPRASFQIGRRNLFGKNRSINFFTSVSLYPKDPAFFPGQSAASSDGGYGLSEYRVLGTFREPRAFDTAADATLTGILEQQIRSSFNFSRRSVGIEVSRRLTGEVSVSGNYQIQRTRVFDEKVSPSEQLLIDRRFAQVRLSSFSGTVISDTRDDQIEPRSGHYWSVNGQLAARRIGSQVGFAKSFVTGQLFRTLPHTNRMVFAADARLGLAAGFPRDVVRTDVQRQSVGEVDQQPIVETVQDLPASERFFAGGDTTVRGFALDTLGTTETIKEGFAVGGNGLVIFNAELRLPVRGGLGVVGFIDAGNVFARVTDLDLTELRGAIGFGFRYRSPVGPLRVDIGFKLNREEIVQGRREGLTAVHVSFGQAF